MGGVRLLFAMLAIVAVAPITVVADATPVATPTAACAFPPISIDLLREIRDEIVANPPPTPTIPEPNYFIVPHASHALPPARRRPHRRPDCRFGSAVPGRLCRLRAGRRLASLYGAWTEDFIFRSIDSASPERSTALIRVIEMEAGTPMFAHPEIQSCSCFGPARSKPGTLSPSSKSFARSSIGRCSCFRTATPGA